MPTVVVTDYDFPDMGSIHVPLTPETEELSDADAFARMDEAATLVDGEIGAAGLDGMPEEPPDCEALFDLDGGVPEHLVNDELAE